MKVSLFSSLITESASLWKAGGGDFQISKKIWDMMVFIEVQYQLSDQFGELWVHNMRHYPFLPFSLIVANGHK